MTVNRQSIYNASGGLCSICGTVLAFEDMDVDHVVHRWRGGTDAPANLRATHKRCNRRRGRRDAIPLDSKILNFVIEPGLIEEIDDFRYKHRFPSRAEAVKWLIAAALHRGLEPSISTPDQAERGEPGKP